MKRAGIIIFFFLITAGYCQSQDIHFSQFFFAPQMLNPAEIGNFQAQYRANANQKTQWRQVSQPYSTFSMSADGRFDFLPENVALGLAMMNDQAGDSQLSTFSLLVGGSYMYEIAENHELRGGLQMGISQIKIDYDALSFDNQHNGVVYDPNLPTGEKFSRNARWYANINLGVAHTWQASARNAITTGWALHNLNRPDQSFFNDVGVNLPMRNAFHVSASWKIHGDFDALPAFRWMQQATFSEVILGSGVRYILMDEMSLYRSVFVGYYGRFGDSGIAMMGCEIDEWRFAASYDINVSELETASRNRGGFEFSLQYLFNRNPRHPHLIHRFCPVFI